MLPPPARIHDYDHEEGDGTTSSRSSEISMPASLPTSVSSPSASPHYTPPLRRMPSSPPPSKSKGGRPGIFGFKSSGSISTDKRKLEISLPLTNRNMDAVAGSSTGASFVPGQSMPNGSSGSGAGAVQPTRKPTLEVRTQNPPREPSTLSALSPPSVYPSSTASPAPASSSSYVMVTPATSSDSYSHPFAAIAAKSNAPVPPLKVQPRKSRPNMVITHPHNYTGAEADSLQQPPRRVSHTPVPPPTPPPTGPLPPPPGAWESKLVIPSPLNVRAPSPSGQRGKDLPFGVGRGQGPDREKVGKLDGYEERMKVPRYRELYPGGGRADGPSTPPRPQPSRTKSYESNPYPMVYTDDEEDDEEDVDSDQPMSPEEIQKEMTQIRGRFNADDRERFSAASVPVTEPGDMYNDSFAEEEDSMATPHKSFEYEQLNSFSFSSAPRDSSSAGQRASNGTDEAAEGGEDPEEDEIYSPVHVELDDDADDDKSIYAEEDRTAGRRTVYDTELLGRSAGDTESHYWDEGRMSRYSAAPSVYSVLDGEQSEEARQRFLEKVAAMYTEGPDVPPMPTLAESHYGRNVIKEPGVGRRRMI